MTEQTTVQALRATKKLTTRGNIAMRNLCAVTSEGLSAHTAAMREHLTSAAVIKDRWFKQHAKVQELRAKIKKLPIVSKDLLAAVSVAEECARVAFDYVALGQRIQETEERRIEVSRRHEENLADVAEIIHAAATAAAHKYALLTKHTGADIPSHAEFLATAGVGSTPAHGQRASFLTRALDTEEGAFPTLDDTWSIPAATGK